MVRPTVVPKLNGLTNSTSANAVVEFKTKTLFNRGEVPSAADPSRLTVSLELDAANPPPPPKICICPAPVPTVREKIPLDWNTPLAVIERLLLVGSPIPSCACNIPPTIEVAPVYVLEPLNSHNPVLPLLTESAETPLSTRLSLISLSPVEFPVSVSVRTPVPAKATVPVFANTNAALF